MRDLLLALFILAMLPYIFKRPAIGALLWAWVSIMNPHRETWGFAQSIPWGQMIALATLTALLFHKERKPLPMAGGVVLLLMFMAWMTITSVFALNPVKSEVWDRWTFMLKVFVMLLATLMLLRGRKQIDALIMVVVLSLAYFGVKGGVFTLLTGGQYRVWGPLDSMIQGNNELAVALVIALPLMYYLQATCGKRWLRIGLLFCMACCALAVLGTQSRGALLSVTAMALVLGLKSRYPARFSVALLVVGAAMVSFMPDSWQRRMDTIATYQEDQSAMQRIWTWTTLWNAAVDRPLIGTGFRADNPVVYDLYGLIPGFEHFHGRWTPVAHSVYFQALGEHGFPGLLLFVSIGLWLWFRASALARSTRDDPEYRDWVPLLMRMCQVSIVGYAVGGAFLSLMLFDVPYYIVGLVVLVQATVNERRAAAVPGPVPPGPLTRDPYVQPRRPPA
jgi:probable O-glycosylation ligase (exosortase A-associated)